VLKYANAAVSYQCIIIIMHMPDLQMAIIKHFKNLNLWLYYRKHGRTMNPKKQVLQTLVIE